MKTLGSFRILPALLLAALVLTPLVALHAQPAPTVPHTETDGAERGGGPEGGDAEQALEAEQSAPLAGGDESEARSLAQRVDDAFGVVLGRMAAVLFFKIPLGGGQEGAFIVLWLIVGAIFLTFRMGFINLRGFRHAIDVLRGRYDDPTADGEVSHFQALSSALSATVGLGNIAGVALAVTAGGPGAVFWMMVAAVFGMTAKFTECTLGQKYRRVDAQGHVTGGPMRYLQDGLAEKGMRPLGKVLALFFAVFCIGGSFGGGNMFQANQAFNAVNESVSRSFGVNLPAELFGIVLAAAVGVVIIGGIRRIATTAARVVPLMCGMYLLAALFIVVTNIVHLPHALGVIFDDAFTGKAVGGGMLGAMLMGIQRAAFSNEAGIGSAAIAHSAARTNEPVREGMVALLEPFIDTIIVCFATGIVIVVSGVYDDPGAAEVGGAVLTMRAFEQTISWFPLLLTLAIVLFAFSTMISWSYYGERCWTTLFGPRSSLSYRVLFLIFVFVGSVSTLTNVMDFSDLMILSMAFPNILGLYILSSDVRRDVDGYMSKLRDGKFPVTE